MSNIRNLNQQNPFWDWISQHDGATHPFMGAYQTPPPHNSHTEGRSAPQERPTPPPYSAPPPAGNAYDPEQSIPSPHDFPFSGRRGGAHHHGGPHGHRGPHHGRGGPWGGRCGAGFGGFPMNGGNFDMSKIAEFISQFVPEEIREGLATKDPSSKDNKDFTPPADIFDTEDAYVVHVSLPGAKKEDVGVNWDADKSELNVAGVIYRPGDEEFLKALALDERKIGVFERKVRLGSRANPAQVDADGIAAKMEDGVLMITISKLDHDIVDVKKVDIE